ncbi:hypothetical protein SAY87_026192 [Trapa incisa]|uniref:Uncharacterized protein n=1 Tax=Trapa incisa TaxID=236973 RepID=A0AAN7GJ20_9MYRT|nr:hypothetical protein SAY87_026192 [Trapa incisa]
MRGLLRGKMVINLVFQKSTNYIHSHFLFSLVLFFSSLASSIDAFHCRLCFLQQKQSIKLAMKSELSSHRGYEHVHSPVKSLIVLYVSKTKSLLRISLYGWPFFTLDIFCESAGEYDHVHSPVEIFCLICI